MPLEKRAEAIAHLHGIFGGINAEDGCMHPEIPR